MVCDITTWRVRIGQFNAVVSTRFSRSFNTSLIYLLLISNIFAFIVHFINIFLTQCIFLSSVSYMSTSNLFLIDTNILIVTYFYFIKLILILSGDIETNPGPNEKNDLSVCFWNVNSISAYNFEKLSLLQGYNCIHKFDIICLAETYLDSSFANDDLNLTIDGYNIIRADNPLDVKRGGVCIFYKETLPIKIINITPMTECLVLEISCANKKCVIASLYRSPSQDYDEFEQFLQNLDLLINNAIININPDCFIMLGDFNAKLNAWLPNDNNTHEGISINNLTSSYGLTQLINKPTHILPNSSSCIDLIFTNQPNMIINSNVHTSLHPRCHHQIIYAKINFKIHYPPPYERRIWHYNRANIEGIRKSIEKFNWERTFLNINVEKQVEIFNDVLINIFLNFIPNEIITINDKDPPWISEKIKKLIIDVNALYSQYILRDINPIEFETIIISRQNILEIVNKSKEAYYNRLCNKLRNPKTSPKAYWSILKSFYSDKKIPIIPPVLHENSIITDTKIKAELFNNHFANQCKILQNSSTVPDIAPNVNHPNLLSLEINPEDILKLIRNLDPNKSHGFDGISIRMIKMCDESIIKPLNIIFKNSINEGTFPSQWKKANVTPIYKNGEKKLIKNYRPISVLPVCGKLFEKLIYNVLYKYLDDNNLLNINQSGFRSGDSCTNQLVSITHKIFQSFDANPPLEVRGVFLDISKAFDKVWHDGLLYKLKCNGVKGNFSKLLASFLMNRHQRIILNGQHSTWTKISAGVPQGSILGPLLFLVYINDITIGLDSEVKLFADDTCLFSVITQPNLTANTLNLDLAKISNWAFRNKMSFNPDISKPAHEVIFSRKILNTDHPNLFFNGLLVEKTPVQKHLGVHLDEKLTFTDHLISIIEKANRGINILRKLRNHLPRPALLTLYKTFIRSHLDYADVIYDQPNNSSFKNKIESIQYNSMLAITGAIRGTSREKLNQELGIESLSSRRWVRRLSLLFSIIKNQSPSYLSNLIPPEMNIRNTRNHLRIPNIFCRTNYFANSFFPFTIREWNKLDGEIIDSVSLQRFRKNLNNIVRPISNSIFGIHNPKGIQLLTRLRLGFSHLREHKFRHGFNDIVDALCPCGQEVETTSHFFLRCQNFDEHRAVLMNELLKIDPDIHLLDEISMTNLLLYGKKNFSNFINSQIIKNSIDYIISSNRFDESLY